MKFLKAATLRWDPEDYNKGHLMGCRLDEYAKNVLAVSSKEDRFKIIDIDSNDVSHEVRDVGSKTLCMDATENANKIAFGTKKGEVNVLSWI